MRLDWTDIRGLYEIPGDIALPPDLPRRRWQISPVLGLVLVLGIIAVFASAVIASAALEWLRWLRGETDFPWQMLPIVIVFIWLCGSVIVRRRDLVDADDDAPPALASEGSLLTEHERAAMQAVASRIPSMLRALAFAWGRPLTVAAVVFAVGLPITSLSTNDLEPLLCCWPAVLLAVPLIEAVRLFSSLAHLRTCLNNGKCTGCGYDLTALESTPRWTRCPECGQLSPARLA